MQSLIVNGKLPCTKEECATLGAIQFRIYELSYIRMIEIQAEKRKKKSTLSKEISSVTPVEESTKKETVQISSIDNIQKQAKTLKQIDEKTEEVSQHEEKSLKESQSLDIANTEAKQQPVEDEPLKTPTSEIESTIKQKNQIVKDEINKLIRSMSETSKLVDKIISNESVNLKMPVLTNGAFESAFFYLKSCSCLSSQRALRLISIKQLVSPSYQRSSDIIKSIKSNLLIIARYFYSKKA